MIIAIDGPAASGKSTVARAVAESLGARYVDTGAMYRALTWKVLAEGADPDDADTVARLARALDLALEQPRERPFAAPRVHVDGLDVTEAIRSPEVNSAVSRVARVAEARKELVRRQRDLAAGIDAVVEGRDIGTVVFPEATLKVFLTADPAERSRRRFHELERQGVRGADERHARIRERDHIDSNRADSPLARAEDATVIDTTAMGIDDVVSAVLALVDGLGLEPPAR